MMSMEKKKAKGWHKKNKPLVPKWKLFRAKEPLLSVFMWGVNHSIQQLAHVPSPIMLMPDDFKAYSKVKVDNHAFNKDNMPSKFKFKDYCPNVFRILRERFGVDDSDYLRSLTYEEPTPRDNPGRSCSKFYTTIDDRFIVKTLSAEEVAEVHGILKQYHEYVVEKHGKTLLPQYLGMYRVTVDNTETYMVVMRNIFGRKYPVHRKYDLKGSTVQRAASEKEKAKELPTLKDCDFIDENVDINLPEDAKTKLLELLACDTQFLARQNMMDYSLLLGVHDCALAAKLAAEEEERDKERRERGATSAGGDSSEAELAGLGDDEGDDALSQPTPPQSPIPSTGAFAPLLTGDGLELDKEFYAIPSSSSAQNKEIYFLGLVDILTYYGVKKKTASAAKTVKYGPEGEFSTVKPEQYARRLVDFVTRYVCHLDGNSGAPGFVSRADSKDKDRDRQL